jgi:hypothetical protein
MVSILHARYQSPFFYWHVLTRCLRLVCAYSCRRSQSTSRQYQQQLIPPPLSSSSSNAAFFPKPRHEELYEEPRQPSRRLELVLFIALGKLAIVHQVTVSYSVDRCATASTDDICVCDLATAGHRG